MSNCNWFHCKFAFSPGTYKIFNFQHKSALVCVCICVSCHCVRLCVCVCGWQWPKRHASVRMTMAGWLGATSSVIFRFLLRQRDCNGNGKPRGCVPQSLSLSIRVVNSPPFTHAVSLSLIHSVSFSYCYHNNNSPRNKQTNVFIVRPF